MFPQCAPSQNRTHAAMLTGLIHLRGTLDRAIHLGPLDSTAGNNLVGYFDSAHADTATKRSTCGYLFTLYGGIISWSTKVQRTIALSSTEAEYMAGTEATREAVWLKRIVGCRFSPFSFHFFYCLAN